MEARLRNQMYKFAGLEGPAGPDGPTGPEGAEGPEGVAGADGLDGSVITSGTADPTGLPGNETDVYLQVDANDLVLASYQMLSGVWTLVGDITRDITEDALIDFNGYVRLQNRLLIQWGATTSDANGDAVVSFSTDWTSGQMFQWVGCVAGGTDIDNVYSIKKHTLILTGSVMTLEVKCKRVRNNAGTLVLENAASLPFHWIAVGI